MTKAKKTVKDEEEEEPEEQTSSSFREDLFGKVIDEETARHLIRAGLELVQAMDKAMPRSKFPPEVKKHYKNGKREFLLMARAMIDHEIERVDKKKAPREPRLRKIELS